MRALPAAPDGHHDYAGGLLEHTVGVATICRELCQLHPRLRPDLLLAAALLHDVGRTVELEPGPGVPADLGGPAARPRPSRCAADRGTRRRARRGRTRRAPPRRRLPPRRPRREDGRGGRPVPREPAGRGRRDAAGRELLARLGRDPARARRERVVGSLRLPRRADEPAPLAPDRDGDHDAARPRRDRHDRRRPRRAAAGDVVRPVGGARRRARARSGSPSLYQGLAVGQMGVVAPISATAPLIPIVVGLARGERPSSLQVGRDRAARSSAWC